MRRLVIILLGAALTLPLVAATRKLPLKTGWRFRMEDGPAERFAARGIDETGWRSVRVPHDWGVDRSYDPSLFYRDAFLKVYGIGWYRIDLGGVEVPAGGKVLFECDGAMSHSQVWINGVCIGGWPYGYTRWRVDLTPHLRADGGNLLAVRCDNREKSSRWYTGGGLIRDCRLLVLPRDHVVPGSVFITTPEVTDRSAMVRVSYEMSESGPRSRTFRVENPRRWDVDDPYLYTVDIEGDEYRYGIRTLAFHADQRRFELNGRTVPLNGVSIHHDFGVLGAAWNRSAMRRRLMILKEAGVNAVRQAHNPPGEEFLDLSDELGLLVQDEVFDEWRLGKNDNGYAKIFDEWHERDVRAWVRTDRNHPSVIMYSVGNEIVDGHPAKGPTADYIATARHLAAIVAAEDPTRPCTTANNDPANFTNDYPRALALMGCNYYSQRYADLRRLHPSVPYLATESVCMSSTRGEYAFPVRQAWPKPGKDDPMYNSSYCWEACRWNAADPDATWACPPDLQWFRMDADGTCLGEFPWTGFDYLGGPLWCDEWRQATGHPEKMIHSCNSGLCDLAGFRKDAFWLFQSRYRPDLPMAHILPHWNWEGREGEVTPVYVFTTGDEGELFLNGRSLGRRRKDGAVWDRAYRLRWDDVRYEPGVLEVVVRKNGRDWAHDVVRTAGAPARLEVCSESPTLAADGESVGYVDVRVVDANGVIAPRAANEIVFAVDGPGEIVATDNGDETDSGDFHSPRRHAFNGLAQAVVRARPGASGALRVTVYSDGLLAGSCQFVLKGCDFLK